MFHQQWVQVAQSALMEIGKSYPASSAEERESLRNLLQDVKKSCDQMLEAWSVVEEQIAHLLTEYPDLRSGEKEIEEEFWLDESTVRRFRQGQGYYGLTMFDEAQQLFQQVVNTEPEFLLGRMYLGLSQFQQNEFVTAAEHFQLVSSQATHQVFVGFANHMLGCIAVKQRDDERAIQQFEKVVALLPDHSDAWFNLGACHYRAGRYQEAIPHFYHALALNEHDWESMYYLSSCYRHYKEWKSVSFWRLASYEKKKHPRVLESIAHDYEEMGQPEQALVWYQRLLTSDAKSHTAYQGISWNLWTMNHKEEAMAWLKKGLTLFPNDPDLLFVYVWMSLAQGELTRAEAVMNMLPVEWTKQPLWLAMRSRFSTQLGQFEQAVEAAEHLIQHEQNWVQAMGHYQKGRTLLDMRKTEEALLHFQQAHQHAQHWKDPLFFEGVCHMLEGRVDATKDCWEKICVTL